MVKTEPLGIKMSKLRMRDFIYWATEMDAVHNVINTRIQYEGFRNQVVIGAIDFQYNLLRHITQKGEVWTGKTNRSKHNILSTLCWGVSKINMLSDKLIYENYDSGDGRFSCPTDSIERYHTPSINMRIEWRITGKNSEIMDRWFSECV